MGINEFLLTIIYILLIVLIVILILFTVKLLKTLSKVDLMIDDINGKIKSLDTAFTLVEGVSTKINLISDRFLGFILSIFNKIFGSKKDKEE